MTPTTTSTKLCKNCKHDREEHKLGPCWEFINVVKHKDFRNVVHVDMCECKGFVEGNDYSPPIAEPYVSDYE